MENIRISDKTTMWQRLNTHPHISPIHFILPNKYIILYLITNTKFSNLHLEIYNANVKLTVITLHIILTRF